MRREVQRDMGKYLLRVSLESKDKATHSLMVDAVRDVDTTLNVVADNIVRQMNRIAEDRIAETVIDKSKVS